MKNRWKKKIAFALALTLASACFAACGGDNGTQGGNGGVNETCVDKNDDGVCDDCKQSVIVDLDVYAVNDLHGKMLDGASHPGVDELSTYLNNARAQNPNTILLSSGDTWQGTSESNLTRGYMLTEWMNEMNFVSMTLGNHEFDWGEEAIIENETLAEFPFLALNIYDRDTDERVEYCDASVMIEQGGLKIGIIGAMGDCYDSIAVDKTEGVEFKVGYELTTLVKEEAESLRLQGADCIIYSVHDDYSNYDDELSDYVDVVFEAHTHSSYVKQDSEGVYHLQGGGDNKGITHAKLKVNFARNEADTYEAETISTSVYSGLDPDPIVATVAARYADQIAKATEVLGKNDRTRNSAEISSLIAKLYYEAGVKKWGSQYDIVLGGGSLNLRSPYQILGGNVIYGDVQNVLPFDNHIELCSVTGAVLKTRFIQNSKYVTYYDSSLLSNIVDTQEYYIVLDTWSSRYADNKATVIARYDETTFARDLLADFIRGGGWTTQTSDEIAYTSISRILEIGNALADNEETTEVYYVKARIVSAPQATYGNCTVEDKNGDQLYVYGLYDENGNGYGAMTNPPQAGDTVVLRSVIKKYVNDSGTTTKVEFIDAVLISVE